jgi:hypothetical protein
MNLFFSEYFDVNEATLEEYGAFNISLIVDLPLFVDPFLLFNSDNPVYANLHEQMINYLRFLKTKSESRPIDKPLLRAWYMFGEVKQNWFGFCEKSNSGRGLGTAFAQALNENFSSLFLDFGKETVTKGSHLEKLCLIGKGVGRDMISDFTNNLIKDFLLTYTSTFAQEHIEKSQLRKFAVDRAYFSFETERWMPKSYILPYQAERNDYVLLTPKDILTKDETWINYTDMIHNFEEIPIAAENSQLRAEINNYFYSKLPRGKEAKKNERFDAINATLRKYPRIIDWYIQYKENNGNNAIINSSLKVFESDLVYRRHFSKLIQILDETTKFYSLNGNTKNETLEKINFFKDVIENKGGHRYFYDSKNKPIRRESDVHILFRLVWHKTPSDVSREVNDGRGPADYKISRGSTDKTLVEFKLANNSKLKQNLEKQLAIYALASDANAGFKVIIYFSEEEHTRALRIMKELRMEKDPNIILIDACFDNKPSASKAA